MLKEALEYLKIKSLDAPCVVDVHEDNREYHKLIYYGNGVVEEQGFPKDPPKRQHVIYSIAGLIQLLNSDFFANESGVVFVGKNRITVDLAYKQHDTQQLVAPLAYCNEYMQLKNLFCGLQQKAAWKALHTLDKNINTVESLVLALSELNIKAIQESASKIDKSGFKTTVRGDSVQIEYGSNDGTVKKDFPRSHKYIGPVWECDDSEIEIPLQFYIDNESSVIKFCFQPIGLDRELREHRLRLVSYLQDELDEDKFNVIEGDRDPVDADDDDIYF